MPVQVQNLFVPVGGLETEVDDKLLPLGKMLDLENAYMPRVGEAAKRFGTTRLIDPIGQPYALATHKGALVALPDADPLQVLPTPTTAEWIRGINAGGNSAIAGAMGSKVSVGLTKVAASKANNGGEGAVGDVAYGAGYYFVAYIDGANSQILHFAAIDATTNHVTMDTKVSNATDFRAYRVVFIDNRGVLAWWDSSNAIGFVTLNPAVSGMAPTTVATAATSTGFSFLLNIFDMTTRGTNIAVLAYRNAGGNVSGIDFVPSTASVTLWQPLDSGGGNITSPGNDGSIAWMQDDGASGKLALIIIHSINGLFVHWNIPTAGATRQAASTYSFATITGRSLATGFTTDNDATGHFVVVYNQGGPASDPTAYVGMASRLPAVGLTTGPVLYRGASLRSKTFKNGTDHYAVVAFASATQGTHYVVKIPIVISQQSLAPPQAMFAVRQGTGSYFSSVASPLSNVFTISIGYTLRVGTTTVGTMFGVQLATITFQQLRDTTIGQPKEVIDSLFVPGGMLRQFDGITYGEEGFAYPPEQPTLTPAASISGVEENSDYYYALVYERMDAQARRWQSDQSVPKLVHTGAGQRQITVQCPTLRMTGWSNVLIGIYRGARGVIDDLRLVARVANDITVDSVSFVDNIPDTTQAGGEPIYTSGGVLGNDTHPGFIAICIAQNRMWGIPADDPQSIWYSKEFVFGQGLGWSEDFVVDVRDERGPLRGLAVIDNKPIAWKNDALYVGLGTGPNVLDQGGTYVFEVSSRGFGSANAQALLETKDGAMFVSTSQRAGIFLLDRALTAQYVGAQVQRYVADAVTAATYVSKLNQARFYTGGGTGRVLVYDLLNGIWSVFTGQPADAAVSWNGVPVYANSATQRVMIEDLTGTTYTDDTVAYTSKYGFPWLQINQAKGYERFRGIQPVGERADALTGATIALYQNYDDTTPFLTKNLLNASGVLDQMLRYSSKLAALKVVITDPSPTAGLKVSGYTAIIGPKTGLRKQAPRIT